MGDGDKLNKSFTESDIIENNPFVSQSEDNPMGEAVFSPPETKQKTASKPE